MSRLFRAALSIIVLTGVLSAEAPQHTTDRVPGPSRFAVPRTPWGDPALQGIWPSDQLVDVNPRIWVEPWTVRFQFLRDDGYQMFEYSCHEGNDAMTSSLEGARARD